jgi:CheY-like chemotaxis protein
MQKILIVEDEKTQRKVLHDNLAIKGYSILEAKDGADGLKTALREHPDIILLDVRMPKMDGITMMHKLREDVWGKKAAIIILTNYDTNDGQLLQITVDQPSYYLIKASSSLDQILEKIQEVLESK